jgi:hypothetical protein
VSGRREGAGLGLREREPSALAREVLLGATGAGRVAGATEKVPPGRVDPPAPGLRPAALVELDGGDTGRAGLGADRDEAVEAGARREAMEPGLVVGFDAGTAARRDAMALVAVVGFGAGAFAAAALPARGAEALAFTAGAFDGVLASGCRASAASMRGRTSGRTARSSTRRWAAPRAFPGSGCFRVSSDFANAASDFCLLAFAMAPPRVGVSQGPVQAALLPRAPAASRSSSFLSVFSQLNSLRPK